MFVTCRLPQYQGRSSKEPEVVAHTIEQARSVHRVVVSTDDAEVAATSRHFGAEVIWRPAALSGDTAPSELALR